eukprot:TRINITY_DN15620_c0_g1_i1.p1 TRINITY_DN15620_c0_g1~~TRINITY_DN15620_c0_g1_i1.p1  ORF type:complete len:106 (+),score=32.94 TRINITY_DN15620_c0_g1_i1:377-694(+)
MRMTITDAMLPSSSPLRLNTSYFSEMIPALYKAYPDKMMEINIYAVSYPITSFSSFGAQMNVTGAVEVVVIGAETVFNLNVLLTCLGENTAIGNLDASVLQPIMK